MNETASRASEPAASAPPPPSQGGWRTALLFAWLGRALPTAVVLLALGALAWWGHHSGWTIPRLSDRTAEPSEKDDWCEEHGVPESACVECNPDLLPRPKSYGWCARHGVHDCALEHPDVAQLGSLSAVHLEELKAQAERALAFAQRQPNNRECQLHPRRIQVASQEALDRMGIQLAPVEPALVREIVPASGAIVFDADRVSNVSVPVPGRVWRVEARGNVGQPVKQGDLLALVEAAEVGRAKAEFLQTLGQLDLKQRTLERLSPGAQQGVISDARFQQAEAELRATRVRLVAAQQALVNLGLPTSTEQLRGLAPEEVGRRIQFLGLPEAAVRDLDPRTTTANLIPVRAPFDGMVIGRHAALGATADPTKSLFIVADPRRLWLTLHVPQDSLKPFRERDPRRLLLGKAVQFVPDGTVEEIAGTITWVSSQVDEKTRTLPVRADLPNPQGRLRANTFGAGRIVLRREQAMVVPTEAVHWEGGCHIVFVWDKNSSASNAPKVFHVRTVVPGVQDGGKTEIIAGLLPGERVAAQNSGYLRSQLLKGNIAGDSD
jgi:cobalt-zinc-cadmium efflux system membrane fusion protein